MHFPPVVDSIFPPHIYDPAATTFERGTPISLFVRLNRLFALPTFTILFAVFGDAGGRTRSFRENVRQFKCTTRAHPFIHFSRRLRYQYSISALSLWCA